MDEAHDQVTFGHEERRIIETTPSNPRMDSEALLELDAERTSGQPTPTSKATLLQLTGINDGAATDDQRQVLLDIMRAAELYEVELRRTALTARRLVEEIDSARAVVTGTNEGDIEPRFTWEAHDGHGEDGRQDILRIMRLLDVPELSEHPELQEPATSAGHLFQENQTRIRGAISPSKTRADTGHGTVSMEQPQPNKPSHAGDSDTLDATQVVDGDNHLQEESHDDDENTSDLDPDKDLEPVEIRTVAYYYILWKNWRLLPLEIFQGHTMWPSQPSSTFVWRLMLVSCEYSYEDATRELEQRNDGLHSLRTRDVEKLAEEVLSRRDPPRSDEDFESRLWNVHGLCRRKLLVQNPSKVHRAECQKFLRAIRGRGKRGNADISLHPRFKSMSGPELFLLCNLAMDIKTFEDVLMEFGRSAGKGHPLGIRNMYQLLVGKPYLPLFKPTANSEEDNTPLDEPSSEGQDQSLSEDEVIAPRTRRTKRRYSTDSDSDVVITSSRVKSSASKQTTKEINAAHPKGYAGYEEIEGAKEVWFHVISTCWKLPTSRIFTAHEMWPFYVPGDLVISLMRISRLIDYRTALQKLEVLWQDTTWRKHGRNDFATNRPDEGGAKRRIIKTPAMLKIEGELYKDKSTAANEDGPLEDRLWDTFSLTQTRLLTPTPSAELRHDYLSIISSRWGLSTDTIFEDPVWPARTTMSGPFLWLLCELSKKMQFNTALKKMKAIVKGEKEKFIHHITIYDLLMENDAPPLSDCKYYRGVHQWEVHRRLGVLSKRGRRADQRLMATAKIVPLWPQAVMAKDLCPKIYWHWGQVGGKRITVKAMKLEAGDDASDGENVENENHDAENDYDSEVSNSGDEDDEADNIKKEPVSPNAGGGEPVDRSIYDATPAPVTRDNTPKITKERNLLRAFPKRKPFKVPKSESAEPASTTPSGQRTKSQKGLKSSAVKIKTEETDAEAATAPLVQRESANELAGQRTDIDGDVFEHVEEEIRLLKNARLTRVDPQPKADFKYHDTDEDEEAFMAVLCCYPQSKEERIYLVQRICANWSLPAQDVFSASHGMWPGTPGLDFLLRLLVLSHVTKHRTAVSALQKVLAEDKRAAGDILERRWLDETTVDRAIEAVCPRAKDVLKQLKKKREEQALRIKRESQSHDPEPTPVPTPTAAAGLMLPPASTVRLKREPSVMAMDGCSHVKCRMAPSDAFFESNSFIDKNGIAHLSVEPPESERVPECQTKPYIQRTKRRRSSTVKLEKENVPGEVAMGETMDGDVEVDEPQPKPAPILPPVKKARHNWATVN